MKFSFEPFGYTNDKRIEKFEQFIGFKLPKDYKEFLKKHNGGIVNTEDYRDYCIDHPGRGYWSFWAKGLNVYMPMDILFGLDQEKFDIQKNYSEYMSDLPAKAICIGHPMSGGYVLLDTGEDPGVYFYASSYFFEQPDPEVNTYLIADTFTEFINGLVEVPIDRD